MTIMLWLAVLAVLLIPFVPNLLRLRIRVFRWLNWNRLADAHEKYFGGLVLGVRVVLFVVAAALVYLGL